jgi:flavodoxin
MLKYFSILIAFMATMTLSSCNGKKQENTSSPAPKYLVLYYSQSGATKEVAEELQRLLGADIDSIQVENPYDGTYAETIERCQNERANGIVPKIKPLDKNVADYDVIFLGYPIWFGTYARPIYGLVDSLDFEGKKVVTFCTFGSGGIESSSKELAEALPKAEVACGYGVRNARLAAMPEELNRFLVEREYIYGEVVALADYSESQPVTDEEKAIFEAACGDYQFPLGTPVTCGKRGTDKGVDYKYEATSTMPDGTPTNFTIYVTVSNAPDSKPEFTRVVRL